MISGRNVVMRGSSRNSRQEARREEFLRAATDVFLKSGFSGASVDDVIAKVGGSKRTIYAYFGNKEQLFATIIQEISRRAMAPLAEEDICRADLEATLYGAGYRYLRVIMSPEALRLYRTVVSEGSRFPDLARVFFETGPGKASAILARTLYRMRFDWEIQITNHNQAAEHFFGMIRDDLHLQVVLGLRPLPTAQETTATVKSAVDIFLGGVRRRD